MGFKESDLYPPVCEYFISLGYDVQAEVKSCDLVAKKDGETIVAELKTSFCLKLVYQAIERQSITDLVYIVIPRPKGAKGAQWNSMLKLMKRLDIGIITVALDSELKAVDIVSVPAGTAKPKSSAKRASFNKEVDSRNLHINTGGVNKTKILTAYREKSIYILCLAEAFGEISPAQINKILNEPYAGNIVSRNFYGWFKKISKGVYAISDEGYKILNGNEYKEAIEFYRDKSEKFNN